MASTKQTVHDIIHAASVSCARIDGLSAKVHEDSAAIVPIQTNMIMAIALAHGIKITSAAAADLLLKFSATTRSGHLTYSRQALAGWLPGIDNVDNDSMAAAHTEAIGWAANSHFDQLGQK